MNGPIFSTVNSYNKSRFCYSYKPQGVIENCCKPLVCTTNEYLSSISAISSVTFNSTRTSEQSLLLSQQRQYLQSVAYQQNSSIIQNTIQNSTIISSTIRGQLLQVSTLRYLPYQPYYPPVIPQNVIEFQMATNNAGVPQSFFTDADCKGSQSVTT